MVWTLQDLDSLADFLGEMGVCVQVSLSCLPFRTDLGKSVYSTSTGMVFKWHRKEPRLGRGENKCKIAFHTLFGRRLEETTGPVFTFLPDVMVEKVSIISLLQVLVQG